MIKENIIFPLLSAGLIANSGFWNGTGAAIVTSVGAIIVAVIYARYRK